MSAYTKMPNVVREKMINVLSLVDNTLMFGEVRKCIDTWSYKLEVFKDGELRVFTVTHELATDLDRERELFQRAKEFVRRSFYLSKV